MVGVAVLRSGRSISVKVAPSSPFPVPFSRFSPPRNPPLYLTPRERGGTGRRAGLRILWGNPSGFDSRRSHLYPSLSLLSLAPVERAGVRKSDSLWFALLAIALTAQGCNRVAKNVSYDPAGTDSLTALDIYPPRFGGRHPVVIFLHGGSYV